MDKSTHKADGGYICQKCGRVTTRRMTSKGMVWVHKA